MDSINRFNLEEFYFKIIRTYGFYIKRGISFTCKIIAEHECGNDYMKLDKEFVCKCCCNSNINNRKLILKTIHTFIEKSVPKWWKTERSYDWIEIIFTNGSDTNKFSFSHIMFMRSLVEFAYRDIDDFLSQKLVNKE